MLTARTIGQMARRGVASVIADIVVYSRTGVESVTFANAGFQQLDESLLQVGELNISTVAVRFAFDREEFEASAMAEPRSGDMIAHESDNYRVLPYGELVKSYSPSGATLYVYAKKV